MRLLLKRILLVVGFLVFWVGSLVLYASGAESSPKESIMLIISGFWILVFWWISRKVFKKSVDPNTVTALVIAQGVASDSFDDSLNEGGD